MTGHVVEAALSLHRDSQNGLQNSLGNETRSLLLQFSTETAEVGNPVLGAVIRRLDGRALEPGIDEAKVLITFWADEARIFAQPPAKFTVRYGRTVGFGVVLAVIGE